MDIRTHFFSVKNLIKTKMRAAIIVVMAQKRLTKSEVCICSICLISFGLLAALSGFSRWDLSEILGEGLVIAACTGEFIADFGKISKCEPAKEFLGKVSTLILIFGLLVALAGFVANLQISEAFNNSQRLRIEQLARSNNLTSADLIVAQSNLAALQLQVQWRGINLEQETNLFKLLDPVARSIPKQERIVWVEVIGADNPESKSFGRKLVQVLQRCGFPVDDDVEALHVGTFEGSGISLRFKDMNSPPQHAIPILRALQSIGIQASAMEMGGLKDSNLLMLIVLPKPEK